MARIVIIDDHPMVRIGLKQLIEDEPALEVCGEAENRTAGLALLERLVPNLAIVDISLQEGNGLELIREIKSRRLPVRVLVYSMHEDELYAERALHAGAMGYVSKQTPTGAIIAAIHKVLNGKIAVSDALAERLLTHVAEHHLHVGEDPILLLSNRELEVFELIGKGLTMREIAEHLHRSVKTCETYCERLKKKLGLASANELRRSAMHWLLNGK